MADGMVLAYYEKGGAGVVGLAPLTTVYQVALADLASVVIVNAQALTEIGGGLYARRVPNLDFALYWYPFKAVAAGADVDAEELAGLVHDFADDAGNRGTHDVGRGDLEPARLSVNGLWQRGAVPG